MASPHPSSHQQQQLQQQLQQQHQLHQLRVDHQQYSPADRTPSPIVRKSVARKPVESSSEPPPKPPRPHSVAVAPHPSLQQQVGTQSRVGHVSHVHHPAPQTQTPVNQPQPGQVNQGQPYQQQHHQTQQIPQHQYFPETQARGYQHVPQPTPDSRMRSVGQAQPPPRDSTPQIQRIPSHGSVDAQSPIQYQGRPVSISGTPISNAGVTVPSSTPSNPAEHARRPSQVAHLQGQAVCNHCRKGVPPNVSTYACVVCSTVHIATVFCVWCFTAGVAGSSHAHDKSYYVSNSDLRVQINDPTVPSNLWTIRRNVVGRLWYTHNATGFRTHLKPIKQSVLESTVLPPGWEQRRTPDGRTFFFHVPTGASAWNKPQNSPPSGWKQVKTPDLVPFYVNEELGLSTWDRPGQQPKYRSKSTTYKLNGSTAANNGTGGNSSGETDLSFSSMGKAAARLTRGMLGQRRNIATMSRIVNQVSNLTGDGGGEDYGNDEYGEEGNDGAEESQTQYEENTTQQHYETETDYQTTESYEQQDQSPMYEGNSHVEQEPAVVDQTQTYNMQQQMSEQPVMIQQQTQVSISSEYSGNYEVVPPLQQDFAQQIQQQSPYPEPLQSPMQSYNPLPQSPPPNQPAFYPGQNQASSPMGTVPSQSSYMVDMMQNLDLASNNTGNMSDFSSVLASEPGVEVTVNSSVTLVDTTGGMEDFNTILVEDQGQSMTCEMDQSVLETETAAPSNYLEQDSIPASQNIVADASWHQAFAQPHPQAQDSTAQPAAGLEQTPAMGSAPYAPSQIDLSMQKYQDGTVQVSISRNADQRPAC